MLASGRASDGEIIRAAPVTRRRWPPRRDSLQGTSFSIKPSSRCTSQAPVQSGAYESYGDGGYAREQLPAW